jgi:HEPN domain-containing protein
MAPDAERGFTVDRSRDWLMQAERDLAQASASREQQRHEWACFAAQQGAEKAVKALHLHLGQEAWGHVVARLLIELPVEVDQALVEKAKVLDNFYIGTRYPDGHPEGPPFEHYGEIQSGDAIRYASEILDYVRAQVA